MALFRARRVVTVLALGGLLGTVIPSGGASAAPAAPTDLAGTVPGWVQSAQNLGVSAGSGSVNFDVLLSMRDAAQVPAEIAALSTPGSAQYREWLTTAQFRATYAPTASSVSATESWLRGEGFTVGGSLASGLYVQASGTVSQVDAVFGVTLHDYTYQGRTLRANNTDLTLPASAPSAVSSVVGIDDSAFLNQPADATDGGPAGAPAGAVNGAGAATSGPAPGPPPGVNFGFPPCSAYYGQESATTVPTAYGSPPSWAICGYTPPTLASAYGITPEVTAGDNGTGVTIAITDAYAESTLLADNNKYDNLHGVAPFAPGQFSEILPKNGFNEVNACGGSSWGEEQALDVESSHGMAPDAKVVYVGAANCGNALNNAWAKAIDDHIADVITDSWGDEGEAVPASMVDFYNTFAEEAALTGISVNFSSGDDGDEVFATGKKQVDFPGTDPYLTAVGGTSIAVGADGQYLFEHGWENAYSTLTNGVWTPAPPGVYSSGSGGGTSKLFAQPYYQQAAVPASISEALGPKPMRAIPDVSMVGDPVTGFLVGETQAFPAGTHYGEYRLGGTSLSSPLFAGVEADLDSALGAPLGFANPVLYRLVGTSAVHDILAPTSPIAEARVDYLNEVNGATFVRLRTMDVQFTSIHSGPGYDDETGVGTPNGAAFFTALESGG